MGGDRGSSDEGRRCDHLSCVVWSGSHRDQLQLKSEGLLAAGTPAEAPLSRPWWPRTRLYTSVAFPVCHSRHPLPGGPTPHPMGSHHLPHLPHSTARGHEAERAESCGCTNTHFWGCGSDVRLRPMRVAEHTLSLVTREGLEAGQQRGAQRLSGKAGRGLSRPLTAPPAAAETARSTNLENSAPPVRALGRTACLAHPASESLGY